MVLQTLESRDYSRKYSRDYHSRVTLENTLDEASQQNLYGESPARDFLKNALKAAVTLLQRIQTEREITNRKRHRIV